MKNQTWDNPRCQILKAMHQARPMSRQRCLTCKGGRLLCGQSSCPLLQRITIQAPVREKLSERIFGPSPSVFVGWKEYPDVFVGPLTSLDSENASLLDDPSRWYGAGFDDIILMRSLLVRSKRQENIWSRNDFIEETQELALSVRPVDTEVLFKRKPSYSLSFSPVSQPMGPSGVLEDLRIVDNPKIPRKVDSVVSDEMRVVDAVWSLYGSGYDVYYLTRVISSGALGLKENKKLVPTRWSITAIDDMLSKRQIQRIRQYPSTNNYLTYTNTYLENHFEILLLPGNWEYEQFEAWAPNTLWTMAYNEPAIVQEYEPYGGRTTYAINEGGGYYAGRIAVTEALDKMRRQARVIVFREIYESYVVPVGVWEVRENVRKAFQNPPKKHSTLKEALDDIKTRLMIPLEKYVRKSEILKQKKITEYF